MRTKKLEDISILMVVPSRVLGAVLSRELGDLGAVKKVCCKNISEALMQMREIRPDLVVSSMYFEDGDGIALVNAMRADSLLENTMFMVVSGETRPEMLEPMRQAGVVAVLPRPFTSEALSLAISASCPGLVGNNY